MSFEWISETVSRTPINLRGLRSYGFDGVGMDQVGSERPKWGRNGPSVLDTYLIYLFEARAIRNGYRILKGWSNIYVALQTNIEHDKHTSLSKAIKLSVSR